MRNTIWSGFLCSLLVLVAQSSIAQMPGYPAPRYPNIPQITTVEQLMPYARFIVSKPGDKTVVMRPGYGVKGGERVLILLTTPTDPLVVEAFKRALEEKDCIVDVVQIGAPKTGLMAQPIDGAAEIQIFGNFRLQGLLMFTPGEEPPPPGENWLDRLRVWRKYDLVVGPSGNVGDPDTAIAERMNWFTREMLVSSATTYPEELLNLMDRKGWEILRAAKRTRFTDPEGTDISYTWFPEYWQVVEGIHPEIKTMGGGPMSATSGYIYGPGQSEDPLIPGHLMGVPLAIMLKQSDGEGVIMGTANHLGPHPHIEVHIQKHEVTRIVGGGEYGQLWRDYLAKYRYIKYPLDPRAGGLGFLMECSIGTNPKIARPYNVMETPAMKFNWVEERRRTGVVHWGIGRFLREQSEWAYANDLPISHFHIHQYFATYEATMEDGRVVKIIDKGRLTAMDDPEVRQMAAKYGDPDELLREDWIPAIPGINVPGDYQRDYGQNPGNWITEEHRKAYPEAIARFRQTGYGLSQ